MCVRLLYLNERQWGTSECEVGGNVVVGGVMEVYIPSLESLL